QHIAFYNGQEITVAGLIVEEPDIRDRSVNLRVAVESVQVEGELVDGVGGELLLQTPRFPIYEYGTLVELHGRLETPPEGESFSYRDYLARQGVYSLMTWPRVTVLEERVGNPVYHAIFDWKGRAQETINQLIPEPQAGLLSGILLGVGHAMPPAIVSDFQVTGITHIVVISGFNIAIIAGIFVRLGDPLFGKRGAAVFAIVGIVLYTILVGADPSVVRAAVMGSAYVIAQRLLGRPSVSLGSLFLAAFVMTVVNPLALWDIGFQLSFAATLSLMLYADPLIKRTRDWLNRRFERPTTEQILGVLSEAVLVTVAAQILTLPLLMYYFQQISLISLVANAFILPAQSGVMLWGGLATIVGMVIPAVGQLFGWVAYLFLWYTIAMAHLFAQVPYAQIPLAFPASALVVAYAVTAVLTWYAQQDDEQRFQWRQWLQQHLPAHAAFGASIVVVVLSWQWQTTQPDGLLHVAFLDVGQGDAIFIQTPTGRQILVDGGHYPTVLNDQLGRQMPFWDRDIDLVIATHPDADHISGLPGVLSRYEVGQLLVSAGPDGRTAAYEELFALVDEQALAIHYAVAGEVIAIEDGVRLEVVHPEHLGDDRNNNSVGVRLVYGDFSLLLTGDAEEAAEAEMIASGRPLQALVFKAGHHGAQNATTMAMLEAVRPQIVVISVGVDNHFGHPHTDVLSRAAAVGATVLRTDELGTISVSSDGETMWWQAER
ncbi:MAG: DNA internalization-related competence protein ComEC/Rec2, partial [Anaerolineales bacterium]|nr:DNA internalization-related competence protein ComEC/Rec2 [Anaerolineales bacterium]